MAKKAVKNPVLPEHEEMFEQYVRKWQTLLNLNEWRIIRGPGRTKSMADVTAEPEHRLAKYRIGSDFGTAKVTPESIESVVIHELLHIRNAEMLKAAYADKEYSENVMAAEHGQIVILEKLLLQLAHHADEQLAKGN